MPISEYVANRLRVCPPLPTPPAIAIRFIELANDPTATLMQISDSVALDPALAAKMLKVANSPLYNRRRAATNVRQAVNLMGTHTAITVALSFSLFRGLKGAQSSSELQLFWRRSVLSALASRVLAQRFALNADDLLLAGLLQDIGILAMRTAMPDEYAQICRTDTEHDDLLDAEQSHFGCGHDEVGCWLLKKWNLPDHLALACLASHSIPVVLEAPPTLNSCVAVSGYLADVFMSSDYEVSLLKASDAMRRWLGTEPETLAAVISDMREGEQAFKDLFDLPLMAGDHGEAVVAEAKELALIATLGRLSELEEVSQRDALTGAHNRLYFNNVFKQELAISTRHNWPLSVAFIDIDHFKRVNDTYGHAAGDSALITLAGLMMAQIRNGDVFARYGGEEFVLLFPGTSAESALNVLSRIRELVESYNHRLNTDQTFKTTISIGLACHMEGGFKYESPDQMLHAADTALYAAKNLGRNQIARVPHPDACQVKSRFPATTE